MVVQRTPVTTFSGIRGGQNVAPVDMKEHLKATSDIPSNCVSLDFIANGPDDKNGFLAAFASDGAALIGQASSGASPLVGVPICPACLTPESLWGRRPIHDRIGALAAA